MVRGAVFGAGGGLGKVSSLVWGKDGHLGVPRSRPVYWGRSEDYLWGEGVGMLGREDDAIGFCFQGG